MTSEFWFNLEQLWNKRLNNIDVGITITVINNEQNVMVTIYQ